MYLRFIIGILLINITVYSTLHGQQFNHFLSETITPTNITSNTLRTKLKKTLNKAILNNDTANIVEQLVLLSNVNRSNLNYGKAFDYAGEALFFAEESNSNLLIAKTNEEFGILSYLFKQDEQAGRLFERSHKHYLKCYTRNEIGTNTLHRSYYNLLLHNQNIREAVKTRAYIDTCYAIADTANIAKVYSIFLKEKESTLCNWERNYTGTHKLLSEAIVEIESLNKDSKEAISNNDFLTILYAGMAIYHSNVKEFKLAEEYFTKALKQKDIFGEYTFYKEYIYRRYASTLFKSGDYKNAYLNMDLSRRIVDKYLNPRNKNVQGFVSIKNRYSDELRKKNSEINKQQLELAINQRNMLRLQILFIVFVALIIVFGLIVIIQKRYKKYKKTELINQASQKETKEALEHKNKELTTFILKLVEKEEIIKKLSSELQETSKTSRTDALLANLEKQSGNLWDSFNSRFVEQNDEFYKQLKKQAPNLSPNDLKICALIKLNFSGKEMAYLLGISHGSINVARHRLRKKMNIDKDIRLSNYLNSLY